MSICLDNIFKYFGQFQVFVLFFFKIEDGEMIGLLGLFGFGKIILLCIIAGLEGVDFGMIYF